jgi:cytosine/adenosine deaminase-related metal-dependent hydrolase
MLLRNLYLPGNPDAVDLRIRSGIIEKLTPAGAICRDAAVTELDLRDAWLLPGLINSHDHLDFNLFPQMGLPPYNSYREWGMHIHAQYADSIRRIRAIPLPLRIQWGLYKNMLQGFTTVVNHGRHLSIQDPFISVLQPSQLHSVGFEKRWRWKLNYAGQFRDTMVIHAGEGTDQSSYAEINQLIRWNIIRRPMVLVHGVAMQAEQARHCKALVCCPASNFFMLHATADIAELKQYLPVLFGTDSTLSAPWNHWSHLHMALETGMFSEEELLHACTSSAAAVWRISSYGIQTGMPADCIAIKRKPDLSLMRSRLLDIELVMHRGNLLLLDESLLTDALQYRLAGSSYSRILLDGACKWVKGDLPWLMEQIHTACPGIQFPAEIKSIEHAAAG